MMRCVDWTAHSLFLLILSSCLGTGLLPTSVAAQDDAQATEFTQTVQPLLESFCFDCHGGTTTEADIDFGEFPTVASARKQTKVWVKIRTMLETGQMPPKDSPKPSDAELQKLRNWVKAFLLSEARKHAGDPGPVILRRLSNDEYNYTVRDLTGIAALNPTRQFPVDGASGEGFINSGAGQAMSPSLVTKYLDAAKEVSQHAMLLPDGIRFSPKATRRDKADHLVQQIQTLYRRFTTEGGAQSVTLHGLTFDANEDGLLPLKPYLVATLEERDALRNRTETIEKVAKARGLNTKYLTRLWGTLTSAGNSRSLVIDQIRDRWQRASPSEVDGLVTFISEHQNALFKYNPIGHIGNDGRSRIWMEPSNPVASRRDFQVNLPESPDGDVSIFLSASDSGDGNEDDYVVWQNPRLSIGNGPDILLRDLAGLQERMRQTQQQALQGTAEYLAAVSELEALGTEVSPEQFEHVATARKLDVSALKAWASYIGVGPSEPVVVSGHFTEKETNGEYNFIRSWGTGATPVISANSSDMLVRAPGIARPHGITAHPSPTLFAAIGWQSPIHGMVKIEAQISDAHPECGDGQEWYLQHRTPRKFGTLWKGSFGAGGSAKMEPKQITVRRGELISFILGPGPSYFCDLTEMNLTITEVAGAKRQWDLAKDVSSDIQAGNPHADSHGFAKTWHFYKGEMKTVNKEPGTMVSVPAGSLLSKWQQEKDAEKRNQLAAAVQKLATGNPPTVAGSPDELLYRQLMDLTLSPRSLESLLKEVEADSRFGKHPGGHTVSSANLLVRAPSLVEFKVPAKLAAGRKFVTGALLDVQGGKEGTVRIEAGLTRIEPSSIGASSPVVTNTDSHARQNILQAFDAFRELFPAHLCYARIVPVDEVVTMTLFYRQDEALQRLMLSEAEAADLNRMWDELFFVAQEPLRYEVAFEQIREFATQDAPDKVKVWDPLKTGIVKRADEFRKRLLYTEPIHLNAVVDFAARAWRRPLTTTEQTDLRILYQKLRETEISHDDAIRLTLARVLTSPAFLYRRERQPEGSNPAPVSDVELATRLSYFLWSSAPDEELATAAVSSKLNSDDQIRQQTTRMLDDPRTRRLAVQFACQWLHLRNFDQNDEKNEKLYPEFEKLRGDMYEETVRFFDDMFRNDGSILDLLTADHTFLNEQLAGHYGITFQKVAGQEWQKVGGVRSMGRGGILAQATFLASQSGASRTSPILRGNWISETLLGEKLPKPPADVPVLPEEVPSGLTARQLIEKHSSVPECAKCHARIDPYGFALEQFDVLGRVRSQKVDTKTTLLGGQNVDGLAGLREYLLTQRKDDVVRQFCKKLLGFALGREVQLSDELLLAKMQNNLEDNDYRFSVAVDAIVTSHQFRSIRGRHTVDE